MPISRSPKQDSYKLIKVLADSNRFLIFDLLMTGTHCHCEIGEKLNLSPSLVTHHLKTLIESSLICATRDELDARWVHYSINQPVLEKFQKNFIQLTNPKRIKERISICAPQHNSQKHTLNVKDLQKG